MVVTDHHEGAYITFSFQKLAIFINQWKKKALWLADLLEIGEKEVTEVHSIEKLHI